MHKRMDIRGLTKIKAGTRSREGKEGKGTEGKEGRKVCDLWVGP